MPDTTRLYRHSSQEARELDELDLWRESYKANCACCAAIEETIRNGFDGMHLADDCARKVIEAFGYQRVEYVLANTLQELSHAVTTEAHNALEKKVLDAYSQALEQGMNGNGHKDENESEPELDDDEPAPTMSQQM